MEGFEAEMEGVEDEMSEFEDEISEFEDEMSDFEATASNFEPKPSFSAPQTSISADDTLGASAGSDECSDSGCAYLLFVALDLAAAGRHANGLGNNASRVLVGGGLLLPGLSLGAVEWVETVGDRDDGNPGPGAPGHDRAVAVAARVTDARRVSAVRDRDPMLHAVLRNAQDGDRVVLFYAMRTCALPYATLCMQLMAGWTLPAHTLGPSTAENASLHLSSALWHRNCSIQPLGGSDAAAWQRAAATWQFGGLFTQPGACAQQSALLAVGIGTHAAVFPVLPFRNASIDLSHRSAASFWESPEKSLQIRDLALFAQIPADVRAAAARRRRPVASQAMYLALALSGSGAGAATAVVPLPEFAAPPNAPFSAPSLLNPALQPASALEAACQPLRWFNRTAGACQERPMWALGGGDAYASSGLGAVVRVSWREMDAQLRAVLQDTLCVPLSQQCLANAINDTTLPAWARVLAPFQPPTPEEAAAALLHMLSGARYVVAARSSEQAVGMHHGLFWTNASAPPYAAHALPTLFLQQVNTLELLGNPVDLQLTPNAQFLFAAVSRGRWELDSMRRSAAVCEHLRRHPDDVFLRAFSESCAASPAPRAPAVPDFLQVASVCPAGTFCASFNAEKVVHLPSGETSMYGFDREQCPTGYFCAQGIRRICPTGFQCPTPGLALPIRCDRDPTLGSTCYNPGNTHPAPCPPGTLCGAPYLPALPAPPGFAEKGSGKGRRYGVSKSISSSMSSSNTMSNNNINNVNNNNINNNINNNNINNNRGGGSSGGEVGGSGGWGGGGGGGGGLRGEEGGIGEESGGVDGGLHGKKGAHGGFGGFGEEDGGVDGGFGEEDGGVDGDEFGEENGGVDDVFGRSHAVFPHTPPSSPSSTPRTLVACSEGSWCGLGATWSGNGSGLECPGGTYCRDAGVLEPVECGAVIPPHEHKAGMPYCPAGSTALQACPSGFYCPNVTVAHRCTSGTLCLAGSKVWRACPAGLLCQDPGHPTPCPRRFYCPSGSAAPIRCGPFSRCICSQTWVDKITGTSFETGCASPENFSAALALALAAAAAAALWALGWCVQRCRRKKRQKLVQHQATPTSPTSPSHQSPHTSTSPPSTLADEEDALLPSHALSSPLLSLNSSSSSSSSSLPSSSPPPPAPLSSPLRLSVGFEGLSLSLGARGEGKAVLQGVSGSLRAGRVCAVMGPSGAGKSSFLAAIAGKAKAYGKVEGEVCVNGHVLRGGLADIRDSVGFVPQEDIVAADLTVEEALRFAADVRLPQGMSEREKVLRVEHVIQVLELGPVRDSLVGDAMERGISGGQKKRVNIGLELVANPTVLLADEPTSGLDATAAKSVCKVLSKIARSGLTVAAVVHQPRWDIFTEFDDLLLLAPGGRTAYIGPVDDVVPTIEHDLGPIPARVNPADFILDAVVDGWTNSQQGRDGRAGEGSGGEGSGGLGGAGGGGGFGGGAEELQQSPLPKVRSFPNTFVLLWLMWKRAVLQQSRAPLKPIIDNALVLVAAVVLGWVWAGEPDFEPPLPQEALDGCPSRIGKACHVCLFAANDRITSRGIMLVISLGLLGVASFAPAVSNNKPLFWREASWLPQPRHTLAHLLGKDIAALPQLVAGPLLFSVTYAALTSPRMPLGTLFVILFGIYFAASGLAYLVAAATPSAMAQLAGVIIVFGFGSFAGGSPTLPILYSRPPPLPWIPWASFLRYGLEALYVAEALEFKQVAEREDVDLAHHAKTIFAFNLEENQVWIDVGILFAFGVAFRILAIIVLTLTDRGKKM